MTNSGAYNVYNMQTVQLLKVLLKVMSGSSLIPWSV